MRRGHELGSGRPGWPQATSGAWVKDCENLVAADDRLPLVLAEKVPVSGAELISLCYLCQHVKAHHAAATTLFERAFTSEPRLEQDWAQQHRYNAACSAALAGGGKGKDAGKLTDEEKAKLRKLARGWLDADLAVFSKRLENADGLLTWEIEQRLLHWHKDADLAGIRDADALAKLPAEESKLWRAVWEDAARLLKDARGRFTETRLTGELTAKEKRRVHEFKFTAGKMYVVDLESTQFNTLLKLEDANGKLLAANDDISADNLNSRFVINGKVDGLLRVVATSFVEAGVGTYTLTIREFTGRSE
jgi:hypothetical protein